MNNNRIEDLTSSSLPNSPFSSPMVNSSILQPSIIMNGILNNNNNNNSHNNSPNSSSTSSPPTISNNNTSTTTSTKGKGKEKKSKLPTAAQLHQLQQQAAAAAAQQQDNEDEEDEDDDEPKVGKGGEKLKTRRTNQNIASRNYRQRKKVYIKEMEEKISSLTLENDTLKKDLYKIGNNPLELLKFSQEVVFLMTQIRRLVFQIDQALRNSEPDSSIKSLLNTWQSTMDQANSINEREIERFVHPYTQAKLTVMGYKPHSNPWTDFIKTPGQEEWWARFAEKANLSADQMEQISSLWARFSEEERVLNAELQDLDEYIKKFFLTKIIIMPDTEKLIEIVQSCLPIPENSDSDILQTSEVLEFIYNLEKLKQKFIKVQRLTWDTSKQMSKYLTVRQEAFLLVLVHSNTKYIHTNMDMTNNLWNQLNQNALSKSPSTYLISGPTTSTTTTTTSNSSSSTSLSSSIGERRSTSSIMSNHGIPTPISNHTSPSSSSTPSPHSGLSASPSITESIHSYSQIPQMVTTQQPLQSQQQQSSNMFNPLPGAKPLKTQQPMDELFFGTIPISQVPISFQQNSNMALFSNYRNFTQQQQAAQAQQHAQQQAALLQQAQQQVQILQQQAAQAAQVAQQQQVQQAQQQQSNHHILQQQQQQQQHQQVYQSPESILNNNSNNNSNSHNDYLYTFGNSIDGTSNNSSNNNDNNNNNSNNSSNNPVVHNLTVDIHELRSELGFKNSTTLPTIMQSLQSSNSGSNIFSQQHQPSTASSTTSSIPSSQSINNNNNNNNDNSGFHFHYYQPIHSNNQNNNN